MGFVFRKRAYVYVVYCAETGLYKIGTSDNANRRFKELQSGSAFTVELYAAFECHPELGRFFEKQLHEKFRGRRTHGEWFKLERADLDFLAQDVVLLSANLTLSGYCSDVTCGCRKEFFSKPKEEMCAMHVAVRERVEVLNVERDV